jgi:flavodoxin
MAAHMAQKILVVFYSRTGTTRTIANALTAALRCDAEEIVLAENRRSFLSAAIAALRRRPARIAATKHDPSSYDLVIIGTPVWAWSVSSPVRAYLMQSANKLPQVAFFCTMGSRGDETTFAQMRQLAGKVPHAAAAFTTRDVLAGRYPAALGQFVDALKR